MNLILCCQSDIFETIFLGAIGSIVATIILYLCSRFYKFRYKDDFRFNLERARIAVNQIERQSLFPEDYSLVIGQIDILQESAFNMYRSLYPLSLWTKPKSKKLIITLLNDIIRLCEISKNTTVGYNGEQEKEARLNRIRNYFYRYNFSHEQNCSTVMIQLETINNLLKKKSVSSAIENAFNFYAIQLSAHNLVIDEFIDVNSFKQKGSIGIEKKCFTKKALEKILKEN